LRIFQTVAAQTVTTQVQGEKLKELYNFTADNVSAIPPGVDVHHFKPPESGQAVETKLPKPYIFTLSRIDTNKGHDLLLHAFDVLRKQIPDIHLVIGGGSPDPQERELGVRASMEKIVAQRGMRDRVEIIGYVPDELVVPYYSQCELFALPSLFEPFGMTALEAMACGRPVVASKFGGIRNVITSGESGLLVDPQNDQEFAGAMQKLLQDKEMSDRLRETGRKIIQEKYSWEAIAERHLEFYGKYMG
jgi:glycosyltransferase involved in cell wall biosynthesis